MSDTQRLPLIVRRVQHYFPEVDRVADANKPIKITVKKSDVEKAKVKTHDSCAMARACEREGVCDSALVFPRMAFLVKGNLAVRYRVPESITREIVCFDRTGDFRPGEYQLSPVSDRERLDRKNKTGGNHTKPRGLKKYRKPVLYHLTDGLRSQTVYVGKDE